MFYNIIMMSLEKLNEQQRQSISLVTLYIFLTMSLSESFITTFIYWLYLGLCISKNLEI